MKKMHAIIILFSLVVVFIGFWQMSKYEPKVVAPIENIEDDPFVIPEDVGTKYIHPVDWPPQLQKIAEPFSCTEAGNETARAGKTERIEYNGTSYCVTKVSEGAAGSTYIQYAYAKGTVTGTSILTFTLRFTQCGNYDEPQKTECEAERSTFDITPLINKIFSVSNLVVTNFEECANAGNPIMESYPRQCRHGDTTFVEVIAEVNLLPHSGAEGEDEPSSPVACTMDAKICPDGSAVGRTGPHCEFTPCP